MTLPSAPTERANTAEHPLQSRSKQRIKFTAAYSGLSARVDGEPHALDFRKLVGPLPADELTHSLYPYPARLVRHIPRFLLGCEQIAVPGATVLDPFCGSGTVLLEALGWGLKAHGVDVNPLAVLMTQVKTTPMPVSSFRDLCDTMIGVRRRRNQATPAPYLDKWYSRSAVVVLNACREVIDETDERSPAGRALRLLLALSADRLSLRDRRIPVPVRSRDCNMLAQQQTVASSWAIVEDCAQRILDRVARLPTNYANRATACVGDARATSQELYDLVVTSPPYGAAQKYARSSSLALGWLGWSDRKGTSSLEAASIGREHIRKSEADAWASQVPSTSARRVLNSLYEISPTRASIYARYFAEMAQSLTVTAQCVKVGGALALVCAPNTVAGLHVPTHQVLREFVELNGLRLELHGRDRIRARQLQARRATQPVISEEYLLIFRKERDV